MITGDLGTTNMWLAIMAIVSILEALLILGIGLGGFLMYRRTMALVNELESRQIAPLREKVEGILVDVKTVTARVNEQSERVNHAISRTTERVDETADKVKGSVMDKVNQAVGMVRGLRAIVMSVLGHDTRHEPPAPAAGRL
jgi:uncharacterized protein YoxC